MNRNFNLACKVVALQLIWCYIDVIIYFVIDIICHVGVTQISPRYGSLEGGTKVLVRGEGFSTDSYSGANLVFIGNYPCIVDW